ncbi:MAG: DUF6512 family protein [Acetobacter sp.]|nr:DUF6512 family protein [Bacteroides sp.]MCM1340466.1 DUF6512 family protein [Acetobacter sp.]MCM1433206.1 DUF6512 family protein [Clostridiales bacterium]
MKTLLKYSIIGFVFTSFLGTLSHFVYEWSCNNTFTGILCPINESCWEHLKMIFFPYFIWSIIEWILLKKQAGLLLSKFFGVISGMFSILTFFYTYTGILGVSIEIFNIASFFIGIFTAFAIDYSLINSKKFVKHKNTIAIILFTAMALLFFIFTFAPPFIPLFRDPISYTYGI